MEMVTGRMDAEQPFASVTVRLYIPAVIPVRPGVVAENLFPR